MLKRWQDWSGATTVAVVTVVLVILDVGGTAVHRYWSRHSFTSSVLAGLLVLLLTVLIVDRVISRRELKNQSRAIAAQAALISAQARRAVDAGNSQHGQLNAAVERLSNAAAPLLAVLNREQRAAVGSDHSE